MAIIGILAAIAIPVYMSQRSRASESSQKSDARSLATQMETYFVDAQRYPVVPELTWSPVARTVAFGTTGEVVRLSANNQAQIVRDDAGRGFCVEVRNIGTTKTAVYDSTGGGLQNVSAGATCPAAYDSTVLAYPVG